MCSYINSFSTRRKRALFESMYIWPLWLGTSAVFFLSIRITVASALQCCYNLSNTTINHPKGKIWYGATGSALYYQWSSNKTAEYLHLQHGGFIVPFSGWFMILLLSFSRLCSVFRFRITSVILHKSVSKSQKTENPVYYSDLFPPHIGASPPSDPEQDCAVSPCNYSWNSNFANKKYLLFFTLLLRD